MHNISNYWVNKVELQSTVCFLQHHYIRVFLTHWMIQQIVLINGLTSNKEVQHFFQLNVLIRARKCMHNQQYTHVYERRSSYNTEYRNLKFHFYFRWKVNFATSMHIQRLRSAMTNILITFVFKRLFEDKIVKRFKNCYAIPHRLS